LQSSSESKLNKGRLLTS